MQRSHPVRESRMSVATGWSVQLAESLIAAEMASARDFYGEDGQGATALLPILHALQRAFAHVPPDAVPLIADRLNISQAEVRGAISFYHDFHQAPAAPHVLKLCRAEACQALGCEDVARHLASAHGLHADATLGEITLQNAYCLGNCALGPAALLGDELLGRFDATAADALIARMGEKQA
jgi:formate dehydrogenase subunit gamma